MEKKDFYTAYLDHFHGKTITNMRTFSQHLWIKEHMFLITGYGVICGEYAMISGGAGCGGHDNSHSYIVKLKGIDNTEIVEVIAWEQDFL